MQTIKFRNLGIVDYKEAWDYQGQLFAQGASCGGSTERPHSGCLFVSAHSHVYYREINGQNTNLHTVNAVLKRSDKTYYKINSSVNLKFISFTNPCKFVGKCDVTTMQKVQGGNIEFYDVQGCKEELFRGFRC
ncbi:MAG TPA: hypothetical protein DG754_14895 [Bacteroidales bacterium]|jgi:hypothetical protein|nr:hypothetical protein [Bacteroidales bacterium]